MPSLVISLTPPPLGISPIELATVFPHHGESVVDETIRALELQLSAPAYDRSMPAPTTDPEFVEPWRKGGYKIRPDRKELWLSALLSGEWRQILGRYADDTNGRCAMGVLHSVAQGRITACHGECLCEWLGLSHDACFTLAERVIDMNDNNGKSFAEIAEYVRREW